jgi:hypothetical protein
MDCGLRRCEFGQLIEAKPSNHCVATALDDGMRLWTSVDYLSQFTARIGKPERLIAFPDIEAIGRAADGPDAAMTKGALTVNHGCPSVRDQNIRIRRSGRGHDNRSSKLVILRAAGIGLARRRVANS